MKKTTQPPARIATRRLVLRKAGVRDAPAIFRNYAADPEVTRYVAFKPHRRLATVRAFLRRCRAAWRAGESFPWVIALKGRREAVGMVELNVDGHRASLGFILARAQWGRGYTTEAVRAVVAWALRQKRIRRVWAFCDVENAASARVMAKAGMQREGVFRRWMRHPNRGKRPRDCLVYSKVK